MDEAKLTNTLDSVAELPLQLVLLSLLITQPFTSGVLG